MEPKIMLASWMFDLHLLIVFIVWLIFREETRRDFDGEILEKLDSISMLYIKHYLLST